MEYLDLGLFGQEKKKMNERQNVFFCPCRLTRKKTPRTKWINNTHHLSPTQVHTYFPNRWHWHHNIWNLVSFKNMPSLPDLTASEIFLIQSGKVMRVMRMKVNSNKAICPDYSSNLFWMTVEIITMRCHWFIRPWIFPPCRLQELPLFWTLSCFAWNLSWTRLKTLIPASSSPTLILSSTILFWGIQWHWHEIWIHHIWARPTTLRSH